MYITEWILYHLAKNWPSPVKKFNEKLGDDPSSDQYHINYAIKYQYDLRVRSGIGVDVRDKAVVEIGCGHGGIACFIGINGAKKVIGLDINEHDLAIAEKVKSMIFKDFVSPPVEFKIMNASALEFPPESFDLIVADNVFEHFMEPEKVLAECLRVLKPKGIMSIASMPSIYSRYGLHLKNGLKMPWANLFFSEKTICKVMVKLSQTNPDIVKIYPGVKNNPVRVRELRRYQDLNGMTYGKFKRMAMDCGFVVKKFSITPTPRIIGFLIQKIPLIRRSLLADIFSNKANAILEKP